VYIMSFFICLFFFNFSENRLVSNQIFKFVDNILISLLKSMGLGFV
jgi:hypothetical protein